MYMGGNGFYWITSLDSTGRFIEVRREHGTEHWQGAPGETYHATTGEFGGLWRFRGRAPQRLVGVGFTAQGVRPQLALPADAGQLRPARRVHLRGPRRERPDRRAPVARPRSGSRRFRARPGRLRAGVAHPHVDPGDVVRALRRVPARSRGGQHVGFPPGGHRERPRQGRLLRRLPCARASSQTSPRALLADAERTLPRRPPQRFLSRSPAVVPCHGDQANGWAVSVGFHLHGAATHQRNAASSPSNPASEKPAVFGRRMAQG